MEKIVADLHLLVAIYSACILMLMVPVVNEDKLPSAVCAAVSAAAASLSIIFALPADLACAAVMLPLCIYLYWRIFARYRLSFNFSNKPSRSIRLVFEARMFYSSLCLLCGFCIVLLEGRVPDWCLYAAVSALLAVLVFRVVSGCNLFIRMKPSRNRNTGVDDELELRAGSLKTVFAKVEKYMEEKRPYVNGALPEKYMAHQIGVNRTDLSRAISWYAAKNYSQYVNDYRITYATDLMLRDPYMKVTEAGRLSGFNSEGSFTSAFKDRVGQNPSEFMRHERYRRNQP